MGAWSAFKFTAAFKGPITKTVLGDLTKIDITRDLVLGIAVNIPTKAFCPLILFCSYVVKVVLYVWIHRLGWVEISTWKRRERLSYKECHSRSPISRAK